MFTDCGTVVLTHACSRVQGSCGVSVSGVSRVWGSNERIPLLGYAYRNEVVPIGLF